MLRQRQAALVLPLGLSLVLFRPQAIRPIARDLTEYEISPKATDNAIDNWLEDHYAVINRSGPARKKLFLFFAGAYGTPRDTHLLIEQAANNGYHAINLRYPNSWSIGGLCGDSADPDCFEKVRAEIIDGTDRTDKINISRANSIENRLVKLLLYLHAQHHDEGWRQYLEGNAPKWSSIIVAGHSQGGGHAALIARLHAVERVVLFASGDYSDFFAAPAPWLSKPSATPVERYYGFGHIKDEIQDWRRLQAIWKSRGMAAFGAPVDVDTTLPPYEHSHQLYTTASPHQAGQFHMSLVGDDETPKLPDGTPRFQPVWQYLCFPQEVTRKKR
jgi:hypothetical protein